MVYSKKLNILPEEIQLLCNSPQLKSQMKENYSPEEFNIMQQNYIYLGTFTGRNTVTIAFPPHILQIYRPKNYITSKFSHEELHLIVASTSY